MDEFEEIQFPEITPLISQYFTNKFKGVDFLLSAEQNIVQGSAEKRRIDFSTGRYCARQVLGMLINSKPAIMQGEGREPLWPNGVVGSISHSGKLAGAVAALQNNVTAVGMDIETIGEVKVDMWDLIFNNEEQLLIHSKQDDAALWATVLFSLKEAFYKLQYPITRQFVDFKDITISEKHKVLNFERANPNIDFSSILPSRVETRWTQTQDQVISICYISVK